MTKLSVIIPVFNTEKYIAQCLDSILGQNIKDIQIICVNDGSTDNSLKILEKYKEKEPQKFVIIDKDNEGSGTARNAALEIAKGEYILFADSDDWFCGNCFLELLNATERLQTDVLIFGGLIFDKNKLRTGSYSVNKIPHKYSDRIFDNSYFKKDLFKFPSTAWTKLYRREFLQKNSVKFQKIKVGQDQIFFVNSMFSAQRIAVYNKNIYCYRKNRYGSVTSMKKKTDFSPIYVFYAMEKLVEDKNISESNYILAKYFRKAVFWLAKMRDDLKDDYFCEFLILLNYVREKYPNLHLKNFHPKKNDGYWFLKLKYLISKYFLL